MYSHLGELVHSEYHCRTESVAHDNFELEKLIRVNTVN